MQVCVLVYVFNEPATTGGSTLWTLLDRISSTSTGCRRPRLLWLGRWFIRTVTSSVNCFGRIPPHLIPSLPSISFPAICDPSAPWRSLPTRWAFHQFFFNFMANFNSFHSINAFYLFVKAIKPIWCQVIARCSVTIPTSHQFIVHQLF